MSESIFASVEEMLRPQSLTRLLGREIQRVEREPFDVPHMSGNRLEKVMVWSGNTSFTLVLKHFDRERDWVMRLTHDERVREVALFTQGVYAQLPESLYVPIIAAAHDEGDWASLMVDISDTLPPAALPMVTGEDAQTWLTDLGRLHAHFWQDTGLTRTELGLSSLYDFLTILSPARVQAELNAGRRHPVLEMAARGWEKFDAEAPKDVLEFVLAIRYDPAPLIEQLNALPQTLVHGDFKLANLGIAVDVSAARRSVVLDWQDAARGPGVLDLGYFLALNGLRLPYLKTDAIAIYRHALAENGYTISTQDVELGLVAGGALRLLWLMVANGQKDLGWWYAVVSKVARRYR